MAESASFEKALAMAEERRLSEVSLLRSELESERKRREAADTYAQELRTELREETAVLREQLAGESSRCIEIARRAENEVGHLRHCSIDWETGFLPSHRHIKLTLEFSFQCLMPTTQSPYKTPSSLDQAIALTRAKEELGRIAASPSKGGADASSGQLALARVEIEELKQVQRMPALITSHCLLD